MHDSLTLAALTPNPLALPCAHDLYFELSERTPAADQRVRARHFLQRQLDAAAGMTCPLPDAARDLAQWMQASTEQAGEAYGEYLRGRRGGEARRFFPSRAHAMGFLRTVAPTKLVDGAWLFGTIERWDDAAFRPLITTYLEELGAGIPSKNHVAIYRRLLTAMGCEDWRSLPERNFIQGAIQLALGWNAAHFLPELIGFNLGYEQLPLHLLITSYELNELGIDPYYFVLHITVDNASTGHAVKAIEALNALMPRLEDGADFYRRVKNGFRLNELGAGTNDVIAAFDLDAELCRILVQKSVVGKNMHSDYCRVAGRTINDWLSIPEQVPAFLRNLVSARWIVRGAPAEESRFWRLIHGEHAEMFGVFNAYEQEVLRCWIEDPAHCPGNSAVPAARPLPHRALRRRSEAGFPGPVHANRSTVRPLLRGHPENALPETGFGSELRLLERQLARMGSKQEAMHHLAALMSPANHHTPVGLMATRIFQRMLD